MLQAPWGALQSSWEADTGRADHTVLMLELVAQTSTGGYCVTPLTGLGESAPLSTPSRCNSDTGWGGVFKL